MENKNRPRLILKLGRGGRGKGMEVLVDQRKVQLETSTVRNLEEVLFKLMADEIKKENIITAVIVNGQIYSEKVPHDASRVPIQDIRTLEIQTMSTEEVAWHFLIQSAKQIDRLIENARSVAELFRIADEGEANEEYASFLESLRLFLQMVNETQAILNLPLNRIPFQGEPVEKKIQGLSALIDRMHQVQKDEDWVMLADLLEYELVPALDEWKLILSVLQAKKEN
jgi:hypothetical protein